MERKMCVLDSLSVGEKYGFCLRKDKEYQNLGLEIRREGREDERKISPFYRTSSPTGAAALLLLRKLKPNKLENYSYADHLMPLGYWFIIIFIKAPMDTKLNVTKVQGSRCYIRKSRGLLA